MQGPAHFQAPLLRWHLLPQASICFLDGLLLPASCFLWPFRFILHFVSLVIVLEMNLIIWLLNPEPFNTALLCKFSKTCLSSLIASFLLGLDCGCPVPTKFSCNSLFTCAQYLFASQAGHQPFPRPFLLIPFKILLIFQVQVQMDPWIQFFKAF